MRSEVVREIVEPFTTPERQRDLAGGLSRRPVVAPQLLSRLPDDLKEHRSIMWLTAIWYQNRRHARIAIGQLAYLLVIVDPEISAITATGHLSRAHHATDSAKRLPYRQKHRNRAGNFPGIRVLPSRLKVPLPSAIEARKRHRPVPKNSPLPGVQHENHPYDEQDGHCLVGDLQRTPDITDLCPRCERNGDETRRIGRT